MKLNGHEKYLENLNFNWSLRKFSAAFSCLLCPGDSYIIWKRLINRASSISSINAFSLCLRWLWSSNRTNWLDTLFRMSLDRSSKRSSCFMPRLNLLKTSLLKAARCGVWMVEFISQVLVTYWSFFRKRTTSLVNITEMAKSLLLLQCNGKCDAILVVLYLIMMCLEMAFQVHDVLDPFDSVEQKVVCTCEIFWWLQMWHTMPLFVRTMEASTTVACSMVSLGESSSDVSSRWFRWASRREVLQLETAFFMSQSSSVGFCLFLVWCDGIKHVSALKTPVARTEISKEFRSDILNKMDMPSRWEIFVSQMNTENIH